MALTLAPYHAAMRIGQGFNSYTHEILVNDAVVYDTETPGGDHYQGDTKQVSQIVSYCTRHVDKVSEVTDAMNVSAALSIKTATAGGGLTGSYVNSDKFKESTLNFFVQVTVVNQTIMAEDVRQFNAIDGVWNTGKFMKVYGDCYISGFIEGGELDAIVSVKITDKSTESDIKAALEASFGQGNAAGGKLNASFNLDKTNALKNCETTITVNWNGGGDIKPADELWSIESLTKAAAAFPYNVARCPQRTYAILTKYENLLSFQKLSPKPTVLDYDVASLYTNDLLDAMMAYKNIWKKIHLDITDYEDNNVTLKTAKIEPRKADVKTEISKPKRMEALHFLQDLVDTARENAGDSSEQVLELVNLLHSPGGTHTASSQSSKNFEYPDNIGIPYEPDEFGLEKARKDCRLEMLKIVKEVDEVIANPMLALDPERDLQYTNPTFFRRLLPTVTKIEKPKLVTASAAPAPTLHERLYYAPKELPDHFKPMYETALKDPKSSKFLMTAWAGDHTKHEPGTIINDFPSVTNSHIVKSVSVWINNKSSNNYIVAYQLDFTDKPSLFRSHDNTPGHPPNSTPKTFAVTNVGDRITSVQITAGKFPDFPVKVVSSITLATAGGQSAKLGMDVPPDQSDTLWTDAPVANYSLRGFWGESGSAFDRLGVFYGLDE
ncbi:hypothetical protein ACKRZS_005818 [Fusarium odoratissimum]|uniref:Jacalin-type lectin domain-containing protein n=2 Tax=Fusarium oxysporum species complex TaxID=171631 RepID=X0JK70_FUSO5|nr:uncharacterized protein FOIG_11145 [Fusarium odoratissimum NRRL 54006]EXL96786.1 hypothetical protein FOIG_11145 [Fusarium odoratissimum NRRL 54006]KAK2136061.1 hypothetical protein NOF04DRAFT_9458 [Fusarium oxysporum II5]TXC04539.1 hypothetical protein FocTR4_00000176 [Fusarium oxysporum f. sp. cubense]